MFYVPFACPKCQHSTEAPLTGVAVPTGTPESGPVTNADALAVLRVAPAVIAGPLPRHGRDEIGTPACQHAAALRGAETRAGGSATVPASAQ